MTPLIILLDRFSRTFVSMETVVENYWTGVPGVQVRNDRAAIVFVFSIRSGGARYSKYRNSKWLLRAIVDKDIDEARLVPESDRTAQEKLLAKQMIYFSDGEGNLDEEKFPEGLPSTYRLEPEEALLMQEMHDMLTLDVNTAPFLSPSKAISSLRESQNQIFGDNISADAGLLLNRLDATALDNLVTYAEVEVEVVRVARKVMAEVVTGTGFDLDMSMVQCRSDETMEALVTSLVGDGNDLSRLDDYQTTTLLITMKLVLIVVEKKALLGLVSGRLRTYKRKNGRIAIWAKLPGWLRKFYCIGMLRKLNLRRRVADFQIVEGREYMVSPIVFYVVHVMRNAR